MHHPKSPAMKSSGLSLHIPSLNKHKCAITIIDKLKILDKPPMEYHWQSNSILCTLRNFLGWIAICATFLETLSVNYSLGIT